MFPNSCSPTSLVKDYGPTWRVLAGDTDNPTLLGSVEAARTISGKRGTNRWIVTTRNLNRLNRRARNRTEAVAVLLDSYQLAASAVSKAAAIAACAVNSACGGSGLACSTVGDILVECDRATRAAAQREEILKLSESIWRHKLDVRGHQIISGTCVSDPGRAAWLFGVSLNYER